MVDIGRATLAKAGRNPALGVDTGEKLTDQLRAGLAPVVRAGLRPALRTAIRATRRVIALSLHIPEFPGRYLSASAIRRIFAKTSAGMSASF